MSSIQFLITFNVDENGTEDIDFSGGKYESLDFITIRINDWMGINGPKFLRKLIIRVFSRGSLYDSLTKD
jgi:hypothetical protein